MRAACARIVGGAKSLNREITSAPSAWFEAFRSCICARTRSSRRTGSSMKTGSAARIAVMRLPSDPDSSVPRIETGTCARTSMPSVLIPRVWSQSRTPPATTDRTTSLTVPPRTSLMPLNCARSERTQTKRRWDPIGTLSGSVGAGLAKFQATSPTAPASSPARDRLALGLVTARSRSPGERERDLGEAADIPWRRAAPRRARETAPSRARSAPARAPA